MLLDLVSNTLNLMLRNDFVRLLILAIMSVYTGYTLYPVPDFLNEIFNTSYVAKYLVLMLVLSASIYPLDSGKVILVLLVPLFVLLLFHFLRAYEKAEYSFKTMFGVGKGGGESSCPAPDAKTD